MSEYKIMMGKDSMDLMDAMIKHQFNPTEETKKRLDFLSAENSRKIKEGHDKVAAEFISEYGKPLFDFVSSISKEDFLFTKNKPFHLSWDISSDENDNYWQISFYKGKFDYEMLVAGGYADTETLEENMSQERVLELLSTKNLQLV